MTQLAEATEAAQILGMTRQQLYYHTRKGRIPCVELGRRRLYNRDALAKLGMVPEEEKTDTPVARVKKPHTSLF